MSCYLNGGLGENGIRLPTHRELVHTWYRLALDPNLMNQEDFQQIRQSPVVYLQIMDTDDLIYSTGLNAEFLLARSRRESEIECRSWTAGQVYSRLFYNRFWPKKKENLRWMMESDESIRDEANRPFLKMEPATTVCFQEGVPDAVPDREDILFHTDKQKFNPSSE